MPKRGSHLPKWVDPGKFGLFLEVRRTYLGLTMNDLGKQLGVSRQAVYAWEVGISLPSVERFKKLRVLLGIDFKMETFRKTRKR